MKSSLAFWGANPCRFVKHFSLFCMCLVSAQVLSKDYYENISKGFSGRLISYNEERPRQVHTVRVVLSRSGSKLYSDDMFGPSVSGVYIQNFKTGKSWVVSPERKVFSVVPEAPEVENDDQGFNEGGVMSTAPCMTGSRSLKIKRRIKSTQGREHWECVYEHYSLSQVYDNNYGVVVEERLPNNEIMRLENLREVDFDVTFFKPPSSYSEVELKEFYLMGDALGEYQPENN